MTTKPTFHQLLKLLTAGSLFLIAIASALAITPFGKEPYRGMTDYENSVWVEDWTANLDTSAYIAALPRGVNTINIFVGQLALLNGTTPTINGYTLDTPGLCHDIQPPFSFYQRGYYQFRGMQAPLGSGAFPNIAALTDFVKQCKAAGCTVKLSIGGQSGTTFGDSWSCLNPGNIAGFAQALLDLCNTTGADGVDFDYELDDPYLAGFAGQLAGAFKSFSSQPLTSFCVFAGCDASGPWNQADITFLANAVTTQGWCAIDRVYVMAYYDYESLAANEGYMTSWSSWLATNHGFTPARISTGVDPNDPNTSPTNGSLTTWITFAQQNGFSTAIWDQLGVDDYVTHNWGTVIHNLYLNSIN